MISSSEGIRIEVESTGSALGMGAGAISLSFANFSSYEEQKGVKIYIEAKTLKHFRKCTQNMLSCQFGEMFKNVQMTALS